MPTMKSLSVAPLPLSPEQITHLILGIAALRSGDFEQSTDRLRSPAGFCCLGVFTEVASQHGGPVCDWHPLYAYGLDGAPLGINQFVTPEYVYEDEHGSHLIYDGKADFLPRNVMDWYGFPEEDPYILTVSVTCLENELPTDTATITLPHKDHQLFSDDLRDKGIEREYWLHFTASALNDIRVPHSTIGSLIYTGIVEPAVANLEVTI